MGHNSLNLMKMNRQESFAQTVQVFLTYDLSKKHLKELSVYSLKIGPPTIEIRIRKYNDLKQEIGVHDNPSSTCLLCIDKG